MAESASYIVTSEFGDGYVIMYRYQWGEFVVHVNDSHAIVI